VLKAFNNNDDPFGSTTAAVQLQVRTGRSGACTSGLALRGATNRSEAFVHKRLMTRIAIVAFAVGIALAFPSRHAAAAGPDVTHFTLANGLEVVVIPDHRVPVVTHMIWYKVGSADETPGKSGLAHFLEHLMFKGTEKNPAGRFSQVLAAIGGQENAFTTADYTAFYQRAPREQLPMLMEFESDRMTGLVLSDDNVRPELQVVLEEYNMRVANSPDARLGEQISAALYLNHPYGRPVIGWHHEIEKLDREDALAFYRRFYTPNNAVVIVAGDVTAEEVKALVDRTYAKVARRAEIAPRQRPQEPDPVAVRQVTLADPHVGQPNLQRSYLVPSYATAKPGEAEALEVLAHILGNGSNSRLYRVLVVEKGLASDAGGWYQGTSLDATRLGLYATPQPGVSFPQLEDALDTVVADVADNGVRPDELERAKVRQIADAVYAQDNQAMLARWYGSALTSGTTVEQLQAWPDHIRAVTADAVRDAARAWLDKRRSVTGYLVKELPKSGEKRS
jgi:zinc protease